MNTKYYTLHPAHCKLHTAQCTLHTQVNCPGCFMHAIPFLNSLHERYTKQGVQVVKMITMTDLMMMIIIMR